MRDNELRRGLDALQRDAGRGIPVSVEQVRNRGRQIRRRRVATAASAGALAVAIVVGAGIGIVSTRGSAPQPPAKKATTTPTNRVTPSQTAPNPQPTGSLRSYRAGDFTGDGKQDGAVIVDGTTLVMHARDDLPSSSGKKLSLAGAGLATPLTIVGTDDVDGDGIADIVVEGAPVAGRRQFVLVRVTGPAGGTSAGTVMSVVSLPGSAVVSAPAGTGVPTQFGCDRRGDFLLWDVARHVTKTYRFSGSRLALTHTASSAGPPAGLALPGCGADRLRVPAGTTFAGHSVPVTVVGWDSLAGLLTFQEHGVDGSVDPTLHKLPVASDASITLPARTCTGQGTAATPARCSVAQLVDAAKYRAGFGATFTVGSDDKIRSVIGS